MAQLENKVTAIGAEEIGRFPTELADAKQHVANIKDTGLWAEQKQSRELRTARWASINKELLMKLNHLSKKEAGRALFLTPYQMSSV